MSPLNPDLPVEHGAVMLYTLDMCDVVINCIACVLTADETAFFK